MLAPSRMFRRSRRPQVGSIDAALEQLRAGGQVILLPSLDPGDWCCVCLAAEHADVERLTEMTILGSGMFYLCLSDERCEVLHLDPMSSEPVGDAGETSWRNSITIPISHKDTQHGSLDELVNTIRRAADPDCSADDFYTPGLVYPLRAAPDGVLRRPQPIEAAVDLARLAGTQPAMVVVALVTKDSSSARVRDLPRLDALDGRPVVTVNDVVRHRLYSEPLLQRVVSPRLPTTYGPFQLEAFVEPLTGAHHIALVAGDIEGREDVLVSFHVDCFYGNALHSIACDCRTRLLDAMERLQEEGAGVLVYTLRAQRYLNVCPKLERLSSAAEEHELAVATQVLAELGLSTLRILARPGEPTPRISGLGLRVVEEVEAFYPQAESRISRVTGR